MHNFKKLEIWTKSMNLVTEVYQITNTFPAIERFGLIVSYNLKYIDTIVYENLSNMISEIQKMIYGFKNKLD